MMLPFPVLLDHRVRHVLGEQERPGEDDVGLPPPFVHRHVQHALEIEQGRSINQNVNATVPVIGLRDGVDHLLLVGNVAHHPHGVVAVGDDGARAFLRIFFPDIDADQFRARPRQFLCDPTHDVGTRARNQRRLAFQFQGFVSNAVRR